MSAAAPAAGPRIHLLPDGLVNKIAAGEVVERPASVVKELVENAVDAGATRVEVDVEAGGRGLVRVRDDGWGMGRQDALACLQRHATSKIRTEDDLLAIGSFGFRGEALPSIAEVSRFELRTGERGADAGTRVLVDGGVIEAIEEAANPGGTEVAVRRLFSNTPARLKFLKSDRTEMDHVVEWMERVALAQPGLAFRLSSDGRVVHDLPAADALRPRVEALLGRAVGAHLHDLRENDGALALEGLVSGPTLHRTSAAGLHLFVNGRFVRDRAVTGSVLAAYRDLLPRGRYPVVVLFLDLPRDRVDVNVHPQKLEVRFRDARAVWRFVTGAVARRLGALGGVPAPPSGQGGLFEKVGLPGPRGSAAGPKSAWTVSPRDSLLDRALVPPAPARGGASSVAERSALPAAVALGAHAGFVLVGEGDGIVVLDAVAAARLFLRDALAAATPEAPHPSRRLLVPALVDLSPAEARALAALQPVVGPLGVELDAFGADTVALHAAPPEIDPAQAEALLAALRALARDGPRDPRARRDEAATVLSGFARPDAADGPGLLARLRARAAPLPAGFAPPLLALPADALRRLLRRGSP